MSALARLTRPRIPFARPRLAEERVRAAEERMRMSASSRAELSVLSGKAAAEDPAKAAARMCALRPMLSISRAVFLQTRRAGRNFRCSG